MKKIYIFGAGGFAAQCHAYLMAQDRSDIQFIGFIAPENKLHNYDLDYLYLGANEDCIVSDGDSSVIIAIGNSSIRETLVQRCRNRGISLFTLIGPRVYLAPSAHYGEGNIFCLDCAVDPGVNIGDANVFNSRTQIGHDASIGNFNTFSPMSSVFGGAKVGNNNNFGPLSVLSSYSEIGCNVTVTAGSIVFKKFGNNLFLHGNPARKR